MFESRLHQPVIASLAAIAACLAAPAIAQDKPVQGPGQSVATPDQQIDDVDADSVANSPAKSNDIVVTARAGSTQQNKVEASYAISTLDRAELQLKAPFGVADALKSVPGFWVESSGGEAGANIRVRGIPTDGYSSVALLEDGITIQHDAGLGYLNADQSFRLDRTIERVEIVRGGPSSIFYSNAPGASINFITRKGGDHLEALGAYQVTDYNSHRIDGYIGGPLGDWRFLIGGFYRISDGQRPSGYRQDEGGQIRATLTRDFAHGSILLGVKRIDDRIGFDLSTPFVNDANRKPVGVSGVDARYGSIAGPETRFFNFPTAGGGVFRFDAANGTRVKLTQLTGELKYDLGGGFSIRENARYRDSNTLRQGIYPRQITPAATLLGVFAPAIAKVPGATSVGYVYTNAPTTPFNNANQNGNGLVLANLARSFGVPESEFVNDFRLQTTTDRLGGRQDLAIGGYYAHVRERFTNTSATILTDVRDQAALLDVYLLDAAGGRIAPLTDRGVVNYGVEYANSSGSSDTYAFYASDEWQLTDKLRLEGGARYEHVKLQGSSGNRVSTNLNVSPTLADDNVLVGNGTFTPFSRSFSHTAYTAAVDYQFAPSIGSFLRYTSTFRLPNVSDFITSPNNNPVVQRIEFFEGGIKIARRTFDLYATAFLSRYKSLGITDFVPTQNGQFTQRTIYGDTRTIGVELEGTWRPVRWFDIHANYTYQDPKYSTFRFNNSAGVPIDYSGNRLVRVPDNQFRITPGLNLFDQRVRLEAVGAYYGRRYADVANQIKLPTYKTLDLIGQFNATDRLALNVNVDNVTNTIGLTEGNPRAGTIDNTEVGQAVYIARSIFGRTYRASVTYRF